MYFYRSGVRAGRNEHRKENQKLKLQQSPPGRSITGACQQRVTYGNRDEMARAARQGSQGPEFWRGTAVGCLVGQWFSVGLRRFQTKHSGGRPLIDFVANTTRD